MRRDYELGFILKPEVSEELTRALVGRIEQIVNTHDGQVVRVNQWGRRRLAYPIQHHRDGYYLFVDLILTPETVLELDRTLKVSEDVLRHLIIRRDPKAAQKEREEREEREARAAAAAAADQAKAAAAAAVEAGPEIPVLARAEDELVEPGSEEVEVPALTDEDLSYVPPAIEEEESIEA